MSKQAGLLLPIFSLPSPYGIGTLGKAAYDFVDFLHETKQSYWQILPLNETSYGDSPYSSYSSFAGNPYFIDFDYLNEEGYLSKEDYADFKNSDYVDYEYLYHNKKRILKIAVDNFTDNEQYEHFLEENPWVKDYALFKVFKEKFNGKELRKWPLNYRDYHKAMLVELDSHQQQEIRYHCVVQYFFFEQYFALKEYANNFGIQIIGDLPFYVSLDSVDVWRNPELFELKKNLCPKSVAGVPPDYFSETGQLWGNPLYRFSKMKKDNYAWLIRRLGFASKRYDVIRLDHFRAFDEYYAIPYGMSDGKIGVWKKGPGYKFFKILQEELGNIEIIAEDLGIIGDSVKRLLKRTKFPGMKVLEFAFDGSNDNPYLPKNCTKNSVCYIGTHDNEPLASWKNSLNQETNNYVESIIKIGDKEYNWGFIEALYKTKSKVAIVQVQDLLFLGEESRINTPGTLGNNWKWRLKEGQLNSEIQKKLLKTMNKYRK